MEVLRLEVKLELQLPAYTTAAARWDLSSICSLHYSPRQYWILNPLREARDQTHIFVGTSWVLDPLGHKRNSNSGFFFNRKSDACLPNGSIFESCHARRMASNLCCSASRVGEFLLALTGISPIRADKHQIQMSAKCEMHEHAFPNAKFIQFKGISFILEKPFISAVKIFFF